MQLAFAEDNLQFHYGVYIKVHVLPRSREESVAEKDGTLYVAVREKAERGEANRRVLELLRARYGGGSRVRMVSGHHTPHKIISVDYSR